MVEVHAQDLGFHGGRLASAGPGSAGSSAALHCRQHGKQPDQGGCELPQQNQQSGGRRTHPVHFPGQGQYHDQEDGEPHPQLEVFAAALVRWNPAGAIDQQVGDGDYRQQQYDSGHAGSQLRSC